MITPGQIISHYKIIEKLGGGGMGVVYKAQDLKLDRFVALKFLPPHLSEDVDAKQRFIQEAKAASALDHNNIGTIYEIDETPDGQLFIAMAFYEGASLKQQMTKGKLPIEDAIALAMQIAQGLAKAHEQGITHRDIKPANVMLTKDGVVKIVDFGLAKLANAVRLTKTGATVGTPAYMSPEQARCLEVDHRTDIWALGVVLYEMLTGQLPFSGEYELALLQAIVYDEPKPLKTYLPNVPSKLEAIVRCALAKAPDDRYQSAQAFLNELRETMEGHELDTKPPFEEKFAITSRPDHRAVNFSEAGRQLFQGKDLSYSEKLRLLTRQTLNIEEAAWPDTGSPAAAGNPYLNRLIIQNPSDFFGRGAELARIYERIKAVRPQSISLVGVRRIGKSSLLKAIHHPVNRRKYLPNPEEYVFIFMDLQAKRNVEPAEFFQYIYQELQREYGGRLEVNAAPDYDGLKKIVQTFQEAGLKLIFLWDEFESVTRNQKFGPEFYAYFRALANNFNVAYLTSSADQLQSLCHAKEISDSPFFNIFTNLRLSLFKTEEAKQLIAEPSARAGRPLALYSDFVLEIAGCFPFFIQMACSALFSLPKNEKIDYRKAREIFLEEARPHFQEYWEKFDESEKAVVVALASGKKPPREHEFAKKDLAQAGFVQDGKLFSSLFAEFVREASRPTQPWWKVW
ncbi:MAG: protein kinase [candidate division KSB1 bacterium]|nr:protein kinase [candidate division KSB1 bacterium]MDZ7365355.1 protein kinase [candidate division KSB1 bacterium]MDZ7407382.1 protein kinase [candidate division KSB1 bacterium]